MWLLTALSYVNLALYAVGGIFCFAVGLFYLSELVEEYTVMTGRIIRYMIVGEVVLHIVMLLFENMPWSLVLTGLLAHFFYASLLKSYPAFQFTSPGFIVSALLVVVLHVLAFRHFADVFYSFEEVLAYFTLLIWLVPFMLVVSLSANELVLPQTVESQRSGSGGSGPLFADQGGDFISAYLKGKRKGLHYYLSALRDKLTPGQQKRAF